MYYAYLRDITTYGPYSVNKESPTCFSPDLLMSWQEVSVEVQIISHAAWGSTSSFGVRIIVMQFPTNPWEDFSVGSGSWPLYWLWFKLIPCSLYSNVLECESIWVITMNEKGVRRIGKSHRLPLDACASDAPQITWYLHLKTAQCLLMLARCREY